MMNVEEELKRMEIIKNNKPRDLTRVVILIMVISILALLVWHDRYTVGVQVIQGALRSEEVYQKKLNLDALMLEALRENGYKLDTLIVEQRNANRR